MTKNVTKNELRKYVKSLSLSSEDFKHFLNEIKKEFEADQRAVDEEKRAKKKAVA